MASIGKSCDCFQGSAHLVEDILRNRLDGYTNFRWTADYDFLHDVNVSGHVAASKSTSNVWLEIHQLTVGDAIDIPLISFYAEQQNWSSGRVVLYDNNHQEPLLLSFASIVNGHEVENAFAVKFLHFIDWQGNFHAIVDASDIKWTASVDHLNMTSFGRGVVSNGTASLVLDWSTENKAFQGTVRDRDNVLLLVTHVELSEADSTWTLKNFMVRSSSFLYPTIDALSLQVSEHFR